MITSAMRLTEEQGPIQYDIRRDISGMMSGASDSSRDDSGSGSRFGHDNIWSDEKFNTRSGVLQRDQSLDSQSSEAESWLSDSSGSAFLSNSFHSGYTNGVRGSPSHGYQNHKHSVSPSHLAHNGDMSQSGASPYDPGRINARINLSKSYDQAMMFHAIRKQRALANYYELRENGECENNNHKSVNSNHDYGNPGSLRGDIPWDRSSPQEQSYGRDMDVSNRNVNNHTYVYPHHQRNMDYSISAAEPPTQPFYLPVSPMFYPNPTLLTHVNPDRHYHSSSPLFPKESNPNPRDSVRANFMESRAFSLDFSRTKIPDFPCHRAALGEFNSEPNSPVRDMPGLKNGLNKTWPNFPINSSQPQESNPKKSTSKFGLQSISESLGGILKPPSPTKSVQSVDDMQFQNRLKRSNSAPHQLDEWTDDENILSEEEDDDFGFLSNPRFTHLHEQKYSNGDISPRTNSNSTSTGMQKAKSPAPTRRILPKKWRKSKNVSGSKHVSIWKSEGGCVWSCKNGRHMTLTPVTLLTITEVERVALQKLAQTKLQALDLGCPVPIPKDWNSNKRSKRSTFSSLRKRTASTSALESNKSKEGKESGLVFGVPLGKCIANENELRRRKPCQLQERRESLDIPAHLAQRHSRKLSNSSVSVHGGGGGDTVGLTFSDSPSLPLLCPSSNKHGGALSSDSLSEGDGRLGSNLLDALSLSGSSSLRTGTLEGSPLAQHLPQVPHVVTTCCKHLETYGLHVLGIFRIGSSKKRSKQLREELDTGKDIKLNEEHNPHDVAALLKEYFRDLPDSLLTRDLYSTFVATRKIKNEEQRLCALNLLVSLLPTPNRDTLWALLRFLNIVVQHSADTTDENGALVPGNKMDATNLATLFGPNILHKAKGGEFQVESLERAEERKEVISVIKELIEKSSLIFQLQPNIQNELYLMLQQSNPEAVDHLLKKKLLSTQGPEADPETSTSSVYEESDCSSIPHSPGYSSETDTSAYPRTFAEAMQMGAVPQVVSTGGVPGGRPQAPSGEQLVHHPGPAGTPRGHRPATRVRSDESPRNSRLGDVTLNVPSHYRLSVPDQSSWYHADHSPRISPSPKAMKACTPEPRIRITRSPTTPDKGTRDSSNESRSPHIQVRRSFGVPHGPGPGGHRSKSQSKNLLTVPVPCSRSKSSESCSSVGSSSGYHGGSSRSGTASPMTPDPGHKWYLETPPDSPQDGNQSPFTRTSSTHRPLGFNVPKTSSMSSSSSSSSTIRTASSPHTLHYGGSSRHSLTPGNPPPSPRPSHSEESMDWQKERWRHWEKLARQHSEDHKEQETLV